LFSIKNFCQLAALDNALTKLKRKLMGKFPSCKLLV
jgi:hypothetical protein